MGHTPRWLRRLRHPLIRPAGAAPAGPGRAPRRTVAQGNVLVTAENGLPREASAAKMIATSRGPVRVATPPRAGRKRPVVRQYGA